MVAKPLLVAVLAATAGSIIFAPPAAALPSNCESRPWGFLGLTQVRIICDGPIQPDGSWMRQRVIGTPAHQVPASSSCSGGSYSSYCTYYPGGWVNDVIASNDTYPVRPDNVLPDEPGHLG